MATVELLAIGSELTEGLRQDTNTVWLRRRLRRLQVKVRRVTCLGDYVSDLTRELKKAAGRADLVLLTGGLGPTDDDRTLEALAAATGRRRRLQPKVRQWLEQAVSRRRLATRPELLNQARLPVGAVARRNMRGTAPAVLLDTGNCLLVALPGVPGEMRGLWQDGLEQLLETRFGVSTHTRALLTVGGCMEADVDAQATPVCRALEVDLTVLASGGVVELHLGGDKDRVAAATHELGVAMAPDLVCAAGRSVEQVVLDLAHKYGGTLAVAESCTGGRIANRLTAIPGSSRVFLGGVVAYANSIKESVLGVPSAVLKRHGAVSEETAVAMVQGLKRRTGCDWAVAVTGVAGPDGGTRERPVGTVWMAAIGPAGVTTYHRRLPGGRTRIQDLSAGLALDRLRRAILQQETP